MIYDISTRMAKGRTLTILSVGEDVESLKYKYVVGKSRVPNHFGKLVFMKAKHIQKHSRISSC